MALGNGFFEVDATATASKTDTVSDDLVSSCADLAKRHMSCLETMHGAALKPLPRPKDAIRFPTQPVLCKHARTLHALETGDWQNASAAGALQCLKDYAEPFQCVQLASCEF
jgi:hypothetical protein